MTKILLRLFVIFFSGLFCIELHSFRLLLCSTFCSPLWKLYTGCTTQFKIKMNAIHFSYCLSGWISTRLVPEQRWLSGCLWWYFSKLKMFPNVVLRFIFPLTCTHWHRKEWSPLMRVSGSSSEPGSGLNMAQPLFLRPEKIEALHSDSKEKSLTSLSHTESIQTRSLVSPTEDKLPGTQKELSPKHNIIALV